MTRKHLESGDLAAALTAPAFETGEVFPIHQGLPATLVLTLDQIKPYEHNPRHAENPEYSRLVDSIRGRRGLTTPLTVTQRPGEAIYTIAAGGNSRLSALQELYEATGEACFYRVICRVERWESECRVLASHLIENDVRGNMTFGDKAQAVVEWQRLYEETHSEEPSLSQRTLRARLSEAGFQVSQTLLSRYLHTAKHLLPVLPKAFESGFGRPLVEEVIRLRRLAGQYWDDVPLPEGFTPEISFEDVFAATCALEDRHVEDWRFEIFQSVLSTKIAEALCLNPKIVTLDLDSLYHGIEVQDLGSEATPEDPGRTPWAFERAREELVRQAERAVQRKGTREDRPDNRIGDLADATKSSSSPLVGVSPESLPMIHSASDPEALRVTNYEIAQRLAERYALSHLLKSCDLGLGFYVDAPEPPQLDPSDQHWSKRGPMGDTVFSGLRSWVWWWLCGCAEQLDRSHLRQIGARDSESWLVELFEELPRRVPGTDPLSALYLLVGQPNWMESCRAFVTSTELPDGDFAALIALVGSCRALNQAAQRSEISLWGVSP